jgi:hypothetical protein
MDCRAFQRNLEDYLEGGLDFPARFGMERHAKQCFSCEKSISTAFALRQMAREFQRVSAPEGFEHTLLARIRTDKTRHRFAWFRDWWLLSAGGFSWRVASVTALVTVLVVGSLTYFYFGASMQRRVDSQAGQLSALSGAANQGISRTIDAGSAVRIGMGGLESAIGEGGVLNLLQSGSLGAENWARPFSDPSDTDFVEVPIPVSGDRQLILRLPRTIRMRYTPRSQEYFIRTVSH